MDVSEKDRIFDAWWRAAVGTVSAEELYQVFKARLMEELVAQNRHVIGEYPNGAEVTRAENFDLVPRSES
jgi:hypothetical protein